MVELTQYLEARKPPERPPLMYQNWRDLLFLHFAIDPDVIAKLIPPALSVDTFPDETGRERAWVGLVPFLIRNLRLRWAPPLPGHSHFPETNVRTYVHHRGESPGVWFFSLDAASKLACIGARAMFGLPYKWASMRVSNEGQIRTYESERLDSPSAACQVVANVAPTSSRTAEVGTLDFFLIERYVLYSQRSNDLHKAQVSHSPYPLQPAELTHSQESLLSAASIPSSPWGHVAYSSGVNVSVYPLERVK